MASPIKVLVVDDSVLVRKVLTDLLSADPGIEVVGTASDGVFALRKIKQLQPDVMTLDVEMRQMGGLELLPKVMEEAPLPVIMVSGHTKAGAEATLSALERGAVDFVTKPTGSAKNIEEIGRILTAKVKACARSPLKRRLGTARPPGVLTPRPAAAAPSTRARPTRPITQTLIAIGASTGGTEAIKEVLVRLPSQMPPIIIVQHMPEGFTEAFSNRLNTLCQLEVREGRHGDELHPGLALVAPGHSHMTLQRGTRSLFRVVLDQGPLVGRHRPAVNKMFDSVAPLAKDRAFGVILTGMGADGATGMLNMSELGSYNIAQDEASCVVYGMPKEAVKAGGVNESLPLESIPERLVNLVYGRK